MSTEPCIHFSLIPIRSACNIKTACLIHYPFRWQRGPGNGGMSTTKPSKTGSYCGGGKEWEVVGVGAEWSSPTPFCPEGGQRTIPVVPLTTGHSLSTVRCGALTRGSLPPQVGR